ncbi:SUKH-3 domain-containing protein [Actinocatenispora sera]|uniref:SUKH-3 domain-containing protein n=1 Tax=Actinocatenispora sera TaxID=390989 RepID=UPI0034027475
MTARFSRAAETALRTAGWAPGRDVSTATAEAIRRTDGRVGANGARLRSFPAAIAALNEFGGLAIVPREAGVDQVPQPFAFDPLLAPACAETLADVATVLGVPLYPLGVEGDAAALLAMDERGRVFSIDHTGEWLLGTTVDAAIETLVAGRRPPRLRDDGSLPDAGTDELPGRPAR